MSALFRQNSMIHRLLGLFTLLLLLVTLPLWCLPPSIEYPQIPWFNWATHLPVGMDRFFLIFLGLCAFALLSLPGHFHWRKQALLGYAICLSSLVLCDQHRLQPWALQFIVVAVILALTSETVGLKYCRWIVLTIYFYSAVSKFDTAFLSTHGQLLLNGLCQAVQIDNSFWSEQTRTFLAALFPTGELIVVLLLLSHRTWRWGVVVSWLMHISILLAVGPLGLGHESGVLLWNVYFMLQNVVLFRSDPAEQRNVETNNDGSDSSRLSLASALTILFIVLPLLENWGLYDHWPAWAVYSSRPEKVKILVHTSATEDFPKFLKELCGPTVVFTETVPVSLDRWAFEKRKCPVYPQLRYRLALAKALLSDFVEEDEIAIEIEFTPNRWTGERESRTLHGWKEIDQELSKFVLNTDARSTPQ